MQSTYGKLFANATTILLDGKTHCRYGERMKTAKQIITAVGRDEVMARFGVDKRMVRHVIQKNEIPAHWYGALCKITGQRLSYGLFSFKGMDMKKTEARLAPLRRMIDQEWHLGADLTTNGGVLSELFDFGCIVPKGDTSGMLTDMWRILPKGLDVVHAVAS